ncbi:MAG: T9SS type A sorting domain-containing protein [Bacteroidia bacterium]
MIHFYQSEIINSNSGIADNRNTVKIYPNPAADVTLISGLNQGDLVQISDITGKLVSTSQSKGNLLEITTSGLAVLEFMQ